jgi:hypothetical protein
LIDFKKNTIKSFKIISFAFALVFLGGVKLAYANDLTVSGIEVVGVLHSENNAFAPDGFSQPIVTVRNSGSAMAGPAGVTLNYKFGGLTKFTQTNSVGTLGANSTRVTDFYSDGSPDPNFFPPGNWVLEACVDAGGSPETNTSNNCTSVSVSYSDPSVPIEPQCTASISNSIDTTSGTSWITRADISVVNCPAPRWTQLRADGSADFLFNPARVFDGFKVSRRSGNNKTGAVCSRWNTINMQRSKEVI